MTHEQLRVAALHALHEQEERKKAHREKAKLDDIEYAYNNLKTDLPGLEIHKDGTFWLMGIEWYLTTNETSLAAVNRHGMPNVYDLVSLGRWIQKDDNERLYPLQLTPKLSRWKRFLKWVDDFDEKNRVDP